MTTRCPGTWLPGCWTCPKKLLCIVLSARHCVCSCCEYATCTKQNKRLKFQMLQVHGLYIQFNFKDDLLYFFFFFSQMFKKKFETLLLKSAVLHLRAAHSYFQHFWSDRKEALHHQVVVLAGSTSLYYRDGSRPAFAAMFFLLFSQCCLILYLFLQRAATTWV